MGASANFVVISSPNYILRTKETSTSIKCISYCKASRFQTRKFSVIRSSSTMATEIDAPASFCPETARQLVQSLRQTFRSGKTKSIEWREQQLSAIERMINENEDAIVQAIADDFGKPKIETLASEVINATKTVQFARKNLKQWTKNTKVSTLWTLLPSTSFIQPEPLGVVLVISPWNYPFLLTMDPVIGAISAGNAVVLKPSEISSATASLLHSLFQKYLDSEAIKVVLGGIPETTALLEQKWDKIFYTGSGAVGKIVASAAAKHLTPVVLELGGKSPAIVDSTVDFKVVSQKLAFGRYFNAGQTCIASDYVLVEESAADKLVDALKETLTAFYGSSDEQSKDMARIINVKQFDRLESYLNDPEVKNRIVFGGKTDRSSRFISPTIVKDAPWDSGLMTEEIFGPILPIQTVGSVAEAVDIINDRPKPLALYIFSRDKQVVQTVLNETSSGGVCVNDCILQVGNPYLPFGGVGESGYGAYHGKYSFDAFSHLKSVLQKDLVADPALKFPPYTLAKEKLVSAILKGNIFGALLYLVGIDIL